MSNATTARPIDASDIDYDALTSFDSVPTAGSALKPGMLLVDPDLGTPVYFLDHRMPNRNRRSGGGLWFVLDIHARKYIEVSLPNAFTFPVATGIAA